MQPFVYRPDPAPVQRRPSATLPPSAGDNPPFPGGPFRRVVLAALVARWPAQNGPLPVQLTRRHAAAAVAEIPAPPQPVRFEHVYGGGVYRGTQVWAVPVRPPAPSTVREVVLSAPSLQGAALSPNPKYNGYIVTVTGAQRITPTITGLTLGGIDCLASYVYLSQTSFQFTTPDALENGPADLYYANAAGADLLPGAFTYINAPFVQTGSCMPSSGSVGTLVTFAGGKYIPTNPLAVTLGGVDCTASFVWINSHSFRFIAPSGAVDATLMIVDQQLAYDQLNGAFLEQGAPPPRPQQLEHVVTLGVYRTATWPIPVRMPSGQVQPTEADQPPTAARYLLDHQWRAWVLDWPAQSRRLATPPSGAPPAPDQPPPAAQGVLPDALASWYQSDAIELPVGSAPQEEPSDAPPILVRLPPHVLAAWQVSWGAQHRGPLAFERPGDLPPVAVPVPPGLLARWLVSWDTQRAPIGLPWFVPAPPPADQPPVRGPAQWLTQGAWQPAFQLPPTRTTYPLAVAVLPDQPPPRLVLPRALWEAWAVSWTAQRAGSAVQAFIAPGLTQYHYVVTLLGGERYLVTLQGGVLYRVRLL